MNRGALFSQLKSFSYNIEQEAARLRTKVEKNGERDGKILPLPLPLTFFDPAPRIGDENADTANFVNELSNEVNEFKNEAEKIEEEVYGAPEKRLSFVMADEVVSKFEALCSANSDMLRVLEAHLSQFGATPKFIDQDEAEEILKGSKSEAALDMEAIPIDEDLENRENIEDNQNQNQSINNMENAANDSTLVSDEPTPASEVTENEDPARASEEMAEQPEEKALNVSQFDSPSQSPSNMDENPKTPTLGDWTFSKATRHILGSANPAGGALARLEMPETEARMVTPENINSMPVFASSSSVTPSTPEAITDFQTCSLQTGPTSRTMAGMILSARAANVGNESSGEEIEFNENDLSRHYPKLGEEDSEEEADKSTLFSPPKIAKVLQPRTNDSDGWIPSIDSAEWETSPSFLKMQVAMETLNEALQRLNEYIADNGGCKGRLEFFCDEEMVKILGGSVGATPLKIVVLGLVHLKRLDISTENSVKVYKTRRFYSN
jgi:hypothetical protein